MNLIFVLIACFVIALIITPIVIKVALNLGAVDQPSSRKVHQKLMPRLGGLAIFLSFIVGLAIVNPYDPFHFAIILGAVIIMMVGMLDDFFELSPIAKIIGQLFAAFVVVIYGGLQISFINLPFGGVIEFGILSIPITIFWILAITNAINLIDGLDGLASGVSSIVLISISAMAFIMGNEYVMIVALLLLFSTLGFLVYNFYPAKIFMGDTGSLFLGYMIAVLSMLGFKNVTLVSLVIPIFILGVPIIDTFFAIIRRTINKTPIYKADSSHLHHCFLRLGYSHRQTVIIIYAISALLGIAAFIYSYSTVIGAFLISLIVLIAVELLVEMLGLVNKDYKPLLRILKINRFSEVSEGNKDN
ncbi:glycosyltransferase family 4 protein [Alteribacter populi]|uniref:glycosyltransferase family 4 protein n=1 Tax=Alteribacter populi TaxID=2011011 RepID=UPI000BBAA159|nr:MraY family glycosyltransferase [Alteribacter populi]